MVVAMMVSSCTSLNLGGVATNYHHLNNYHVHHNFKNGTQKLVINNRYDFENVFGDDAFKGRNGNSTSIDFHRQFVIAVILPENDRDLSIETALVNRVKDKIYFSYIVDDRHGPGHPRHPGRPFAAVVVNREGPSKVVFQRVTREDLRKAGIHHQGPRPPRPPL